MSHSVMHNERLVELLVQRAVEGLDSNERAELHRLLDEHTYRDAGRFEQTAAELLLGGIVQEEPLPENLRGRLLQQAAAFDPATAKAPVIRPISSSTKMAAPPPSPAALSRPWAAAGVGVALAASLFVAVIGWWPRLTGELQLAPQAASDPRALQRGRDELLARQGIVQQSWQATKDPAGRALSGDVVWDPNAQKGYVRFRGLPANNARQSQYQLWIFDAARGDQYPIDAGVFDIPAGAAGGEVIVPIMAKLPVGQAAMFAVTVEKPGGVVVSMRERIVAVAPVAAG